LTTIDGSHIVLVQSGQCDAYQALTQNEKDDVSEDIRVGVGNSVTQTSWDLKGVVQVCGTRSEEDNDRRARRAEDIIEGYAADNLLGDLVTVLIGGGTTDSNSGADEASNAIQAGIADGSITTTAGTYSLTDANTDSPVVEIGSVTVPASILEKFDCPAECSAIKGGKKGKKGKACKKGKKGKTGCAVDCSACPGKGKKGKVKGPKAPKTKVKKAKKNKKSKKGSMFMSHSMVSPVVSFAGGAAILVAAAAVVVLSRRGTAAAGMDEIEQERTDAPPAVPLERGGIEATATQPLLGDVLVPAY
jgi:hypothetical protein